MRLTLIMKLDDSGTEELNVADMKRYEWSTITDSDIIELLDNLRLASLAMYF